MLTLRHKESQDDHKHALAKRKEKIVKDNTSAELMYQVGQE